MKNERNATIQTFYVNWRLLIEILDCGCDLYYNDALNIIYTEAKHVIFCLYVNKKLEEELINKPSNNVCNVHHCGYYIIELLCTGFKQRCSI